MTTYRWSPVSPSWMIRWPGAHRVVKVSTQALQPSVAHGRSILPDKEGTSCFACRDSFMKQTMSPKSLRNALSPQLQPDSKISGPFMAAMTTSRMRLCLTHYHYRRRHQKHHFGCVNVGSWIGCCRHLHTLKILLTILNPSDCSPPVTLTQLRLIKRRL